MPTRARSSRCAGPRNRLLGHALFSDQSQITIRMISRDETPIDEAFWRARLEAAIRFRDSLQINATAFRLVHGEADLLPSLIVDRYDDYLVIQTLSQGWIACPDAGQAARRNHRRQGHPRAQRSEGAQARRPRSESRSPVRHRAGDALRL
jgi:23S rRNA (cytosine1962-C5)-methyltransferase